MKQKLNDLLDITNRPNVTLLARNAGHFFSDKFLRIGIGFVLHTWMARSLGPEAMGVYTYITDFVLVFLPIVLFGLEDVITKDIVRKEDVGRTIGTAFAFRLAWATFIWVIVAISVFLLKKESSIISLGTALFGTILIIASLDSFVSVFHANMMIRQLVRARQTAYIIASVMKAAGLLSGLGIFFFLTNYYIQLFLERVFVLIQFFKLPKIKLSFDKIYLQKILLQAFPIALTSFFLRAESRLGTFFLSRYWDYSSVGKYGVGRSLLDLWEFLPMAICLSVFPIIIKAKDHSVSVYNDKLVKLYCGLFYLGLLFSVSVFIIAPYLVKLLYGESFSETVIVLRTGAFYTILTFLNYARVKWYVLEGDSRKWFYIACVNLAFSLILNYLLIRKFGIATPFIAGISSHLLANLICAIIFPKIREDLKNIYEGIFYPYKLLKKVFHG